MYIKKIMTYVHLNHNSILSRETLNRTRLSDTQWFLPLTCIVSTQHMIKCLWKGVTRCWSESCRKSRCTLIACDGSYIQVRKSTKV